MKRLMWGAALSLITLFLLAGSSVRSVKACDWKSSMANVEMGSTVIQDGENVVWITSDEETITVVVYDNAGRKADWM